MESVDAVRDHDAVVSVIVQMYQALGDRPEFDRHLHQAITIWESDAHEMLQGTAQLDALRDRRAAVAGHPHQPAAVVAPESIRVDVWGDTAVARYNLKASYEAVARRDESFRVTDVLRRSGERWLIVHHHSEAMAQTVT